MHLQQNSTIPLHSIQETFVPLQRTITWFLHGGSDPSENSKDRCRTSTTGSGAWCDLSIRLRKPLLYTPLRCARKPSADTINATVWKFARWLVVSWGVRVRRVGAAAAQVGLVRAVCPVSTEGLTADYKSGFVMPLYRSQGERCRGHCKSGKLTPA